MTNLTGLLLNSGIADAMPTLLAQYSSSGGEEAAAGIFANIFGLGFGLVFYVVIAFCTYTFLQKLNYETPWLAWIPFANTYAILEAGEQENPMMWTIISACSIIPILGIIASIAALFKIIPAWISICNQLGKTPHLLWTWLLCGLGFIIVPAVLAFT